MIYAGCHYCHYLKSPNLVTFYLDRENYTMRKTAIYRKIEGSQSFQVAKIYPSNLIALLTIEKETEPTEENLSTLQTIRKADRKEARWWENEAPVASRATFAEIERLLRKRSLLTVKTGNDQKLSHNTQDLLNTCFASKLN